MTTPLFLAEQEKDILNKHLNINSSLSRLKSKCKELGINNSKEYLITHDPQPASRADMASGGLPRLHAPIQQTYS